MSKLSFFDYNNGVYAETMLSYYLWGQPTPPTPNEIADAKFIRPPLNKTEDGKNTLAAITIEVDANEYMQKVGNNLPLAQQQIFQDFFNNTNQYLSMEKKLGLNQAITLNDLNTKVHELTSSNMLDIKSKRRVGTCCPRGSHSWDFAQLFLFSADIHNISIHQSHPDISGSLKAAN